MKAASRGTNALIAALALLGLTVVTTACGVPTNTDPQVVESVPLGLSVKFPVFHPPPTCKPAQGTSCLTNDIWFVAAGKGHLVAVATLAKSPGALMKALFAGPTPLQTAGGIVTLLPPGANASIVGIRGPIMTINLNADFGSASLLAIAQIVCTLTVKPITGVLIEQGGAPAYLPTQKQVYDVNPLSCTDYSRLLGNAQV